MYGSTICPDDNNRSGHKLTNAGFPSLMHYRVEKPKRVARIGFYVILGATICVGSADAADFCAGQNTQISKELAPTRLLQQATQALSVTQAAQAEVEVALKKARFEFLNSDKILPTLGSATVSEDQKIQQWPALIAAEKAASTVALTKKIEKAKCPNILLGYETTYLANAAAHARLKQEVIQLESHLALYTDALNNLARLNVGEPKHCCKNWLQLQACL